MGVEIAMLVGLDDIGVVFKIIIEGRWKTEACYVFTNEMEAWLQDGRWK
jgi:hypothetical protein